MEVTPEQYRDDKIECRKKKDEPELKLASSHRPTNGAGYNQTPNPHPNYVGRDLLVENPNDC